MNCKNCEHYEYCEFYSTNCFELEDEEKDKGDWDELDDYVNIPF